MAEALDARRWADIGDAAVGQQRRKDALEAIADLTHGFPMRAQLEALSDAADAALDHLQAMLNVAGTFGSLPLAEDHRRLRVLADEAGRLGVQVGQLRQRMDEALDDAGVPPTVQPEGQQYAQGAALDYPTGPWFIDAGHGWKVRVYKAEGKPEDWAWKWDVRGPGTSYGGGGCSETLARAEAHRWLMFGMQRGASAMPQPALPVEGSVRQGGSEYAHGG